MKAFNRIGWTGALALALVLGGAAQAEETTTTSYSPLAFNAFAGLGYYNLSSSTNSGTGVDVSRSNGRLGAAFGGDLGFRLSPSVAIVALAEYVPLFNTNSDDVGAHIYTVGGGFRVQPAPWAQFLFAGGYTGSGGGTNGNNDLHGWALKAIGFYPVAAGFGPYLQLGYNHLKNDFYGLNVFTANAGLSFSL